MVSTVMNLTLDEALKALANPERRRILLALVEHNPQTVQACGYPDNIPVEGSNEERLQIRMRHSHLPMLEQAGFIDWHKDDRQIDKGPNFHYVEPLLDFLQSDEIQERLHDAR